MPLYEYDCRNCGHEFERVLPLTSYHEAQMCPKCDQPARKIVSKPNIQMDYPGYNCPITGKWVEGRKAHAANLAQHGCRVLETGEVEYMKKRKAAEERAFDKMIEESAAREVAAMPVEKQQQLVREAQCNPDVQIIRRG